MSAMELMEAHSKAQQAEIERLRHDIERHVTICAEQATEIERLRALLAGLDSKSAQRSAVEASWVEQYVVAAGPDGFESVLCASLAEARQQFIDAHLMGTPDPAEEKRLGDFFDDDDNWVFADDTRVSLDCRYEADRVSVMRVTRIRALSAEPTTEKNDG